MFSINDSFKLDNFSTEVTTTQLPFTIDRHAAEMTIDGMDLATFLATVELTDEVIKSVRDAGRAFSKLSGGEMRNIEKKYIREDQYSIWDRITDQ